MLIFRARDVSFCVMVTLIEFHSIFGYVNSHRGPYDPALPEFLVKEAEIHGRIPLWELFESIKRVMGTIWHNGEQYLVLDELHDLNDLEDLNKPLDEPDKLDDPTFRGGY